MAATAKQKREDVRRLVELVCSRLSYLSQIATLAATGPDPEAGASYIYEGLDDLEVELQELRTITRSWYAGAGRLKVKRQRASVRHGRAEGAEGVA